jgi:hypothetical protein
VKSQVMRLRQGMQGNLDTVRFMRRVAHQAAGDPAFQRFARLLVNQLPSHNYIDESVAIGEFVQAQVRYAMDPTDYEQLQDPLLLLDDIHKGIAQGDCDDMALLAASLLLALGHNPFFRVVRYQGKSGPYNHIYVVDYTRNGDGAEHRVVLDCIIKDQAIGYEVPHASGEEIEA